MTQIYKTANAAMKAKMDRIIEETAQMPDTLDTVIAYGQQAIAEAGKVASEMLELHKKINTVLDDLTKALQPPYPSTKALKASTDAIIKSLEGCDANNKNARDEVTAYLGAAEEIQKRGMFVKQKGNFADRINILSNTGLMINGVEHQLHLMIGAMDNPVKTPPKKNPGGKFTP
jgi:hypothetical protein